MASLFRPPRPFFPEGEPLKGRGDTPNEHDILTGSQADGRAFAGQGVSEGVSALLLPYADARHLALTRLARGILRDCHMQLRAHVAVLRFIPRANDGMRFVWLKQLPAVWFFILGPQLTDSGALVSA